jgi:L-aminopeptidase/D-esterase-like protein
MGEAPNNHPLPLDDMPAFAGIDVMLGAQALLPVGFLVGHAQDDAAGTGCTAIICKEGAIGGVSVRGAAPATRETDLLHPCNSVERVNGVVLSGGSAFGLDAAAGVMRWLVEQGAGFEVAGATVPIVCGASLFDLSVGDGAVCPDASFGYAACEAASASLATGNVGAGTGASVGKLLGETLAMKGGFGAASIRLGALIVTALVAVNALGTVYDRATNTLLAGTREPVSGRAILPPLEALALMMKMGAEKHVAAANTTIGCVLSNGVLTKAQASRVADNAHDGYARAIDPVHTGFDGDAVFALTTATMPASPDLLGALAATVMEAAIHDAVLSATATYGLPSARSLGSDDYCPTVT